MKKITLILFTFLFILNSFSQTKNYAEVYVVNGLEAYILNEPVRSYEIVYGKGQGINWSSALTGGLINNGISTKVGKFIKGIVKKAKKEGKEVDAVIYTSGKNITAIKFTDEATPENKQKARVFSMDTLLRTLSRGQAYDVLSSQANIAGYRAVIEAAHHMQRPFAGQSTAAGKIPPTRVMIVGSGGAGLATIQAAKNVGAMVTSFDV